MVHNLGLGHSASFLPFGGVGSKCLYMPLEPINDLIHDLFIDAVTIPNEGI